MSAILEREGPFLSREIRVRHSNNQRREPLPQPSLPQAGESLRDKIDDLLEFRVFLFFSVGAAIFIVGVAELWQRWARTQVNPWYWMVWGLVIVAIGVWQWFRIQPQLANYRRGLRGEREVGRFLERMRSLGYDVFHDIRGDGFNVDHALIGPGGVFAIETKSRSKPAHGRAEITYDGARVLVDGFEPDRDPIAQAEASADHLRQILEQMTGRRDIYVRPVVLFPEWWVHRQPPDCNVWVLNPKALPSFLEHEPERLSRGSITFLGEALACHQRRSS
jgi:hypothetical protein